MVWREMLNADCPRRDTRIHDRCDLVCPDLPKVLWERRARAISGAPDALPGVYR